MAHIENGKIYIPFDELPEVIREGAATRTYPVRKLHAGTWHEVFSNYGYGVEKKIKELTKANYAELVGIYPYSEGVISEFHVSNDGNGPVSYWSSSGWPYVLDWALNPNDQHFKTYEPKYENFSAEQYKGVYLTPTLNGG